MQLVIPLNQSARRPIARLDWFPNCRALIDTGALFPVWTKSEALLMKLGGRLQKKIMFLSADLAEKHMGIYIE